MKKTTILNIGLFIVSVVIAVTLLQYKGDTWEENIRIFFYQVATHHAPPAEYSVSEDSAGIPVVSYTANKTVNAGEEYNPTTVAIYALDYAKAVKEKNDPLARKKFFNCIKWLQEHITYRDGYALYEFNWQQPFYPTVKTPWLSGLTSGKAMEAFTQAYEITGDTDYLNNAGSLLRGFFQPIQNGGFTYMDTAGWWYEEYAGNGSNTPRVLNGHIYALLGVRKYWLATRDDSAALVVKKGIASLTHELSNYDVGDGWSYYDAFHKKADKKYHKIHVELMSAMLSATGKPVFLSYRKKWNAPLQQPYVVRIVKESNRSGVVLFLLVYLACFLPLYVLGKLVFR